MGNKIELTLDKREVHGKKVARLRKEGIVPATVYGPGMKPVSVQVAHNLMEKIYRQAGSYTPVYLSIGGKKRLAMIKEVNLEPVKRTIHHVSFHAVRANEAVTAEVPVRIIDGNESEAEKAGLVILQAIDKLEVKALPMELPESLEITAENLKEAGDKLTVAEIALPEGVEIVDNDDGREGTADDDTSVLDLTVATVYEPSALQAANEAAGGDAEDADADAVESENGGEEAVEEKAE